MRIRRFTAREMREALRAVRDELGSDAVILSNRKTADGVEVVAAVDYDEGWVEDSDPSEALSSALPEPMPASAAPDGPSPRTVAPNAPDGRADPSGLGDPLVGPERAAGARVRVRRRREEPLVASQAGDGRGGVPGARTSPGAAEPVLTSALEQELRAMRSLLENQLSSLAWADFGRRDPVRAGLVRRLMQLGLNRSVADPIAAGVHSRARQAVGDAEALWRRTLSGLARRIPVADVDVLDSGGIVALLGPTGVGKTTTVAKLAARYRMRHGADSAALLTTDNYRVGAQEQLRNYARLLGLPLAVCNEATEIHDAIERYRDRQLILIDTAGMSQRDIRLAEQAALIRSGADGLARELGFYLVLSAATSYPTLEETVRAFDEIALDGCVVTKIDEATSLGGVLSVLVEHALPVAFVSDGQRVPEDLAGARPEQLVARAVQLARRTQPRSQELLEMVYGGMAAHA